jgi:hypothetical protein
MHEIWRVQLVCSQYFRAGAKFGPTQMHILSWQLHGAGEHPAAVACTIMQSRKSWTPLPPPPRWHHLHCLKLIPGTMTLFQSFCQFLLCLFHDTRALAVTALDDGTDTVCGIHWICYHACARCVDAASGASVWHWTVNLNTKALVKL